MPPPSPPPPQPPTAASSTPSPAAAATPLANNCNNNTKHSNSNGAAAALGEAAASVYMSQFENIIADGHEPVMTKPYKPRVAQHFEKFLNPQTLKRHVLQSEQLKAICEHYARETQRPLKELEQQARDIVDEIGLDRNLAIIRWCGIAITAIGKRILSAISVNAASIAQVRQGLGRYPVLYLPSHRSYMDFILMSYICFHYEIEIPGIAAGMDFHSMFGMGTMLRKTGAFFMRRSFSDDQFYWDIFKVYMHSLITAYHIGVEFFVEGTRSRNFKALAPKVGLLSMALLPYFTGEVSDITVVPVSISYERVLEEQLFVYELLGVPKPKESTKGFFKALKIIEQRFGSMYVDFGEPISVREFFGHNNNSNQQRMQRASLGGHLQQLNRHEIELVKRLANEVVYMQQRRIVLNTFNLLGLYFACELYERRTVNIDEFASALGRLKRYFEELGAHVATNTNRIKPEIIETVEIHSNIVHFYQARLRFTQVEAAQLAQEIDTRRLKGHSLSPHTMAVAVPALSLQLYINPCMFWLARPAYLILAALSLQQEQQQQQQQQQQSVPPAVAASDLVALLAARVAELDHIFKHEFTNDSSRETEEFNAHLAFLQRHNVLLMHTHDDAVGGRRHALTVQNNECSRVILSALAPFLCLYYQLAVTLNEFPAHCSSTFSSKDVLVRVQHRIEEALQQPQQQQQQQQPGQAQARHVHPYCLALDNLNIALIACVQAGYLRRDRQTGLLSHANSAGALSLQALEQQLLRYCQLMPFAQYYESPTPDQPTAASTSPSPAAAAAAASATDGQWRVAAKL